MKLKPADEVKGYSSLCEEDKALFRAFLRNFYRGSSWVPEKVARKRDRSNGDYLRVDFKGEYKGHRWLHVKNAVTWY